MAVLCLALLQDLSAGWDGQRSQVTIWAEHGVEQSSPEPHVPITELAEVGLCCDPWGVGVAFLYPVNLLLTC